MKKMAILLLPFLLNCTTNLFSQTKDRLALATEMERLNRLGDSLHKVQLATIVLFV